jgi:hypothetical protein
MIPSDGIRGNLLCRSAPGPNKAIRLGVLCVASNKCRVRPLYGITFIFGFLSRRHSGEICERHPQLRPFDGFGNWRRRGDSTFPLRSEWTDRFPWMLRGGWGMCHLLSATFCEFNKNVLSRIQFPE